MKKPKIGLVDYGMGNLRSVGKALELAGADICVTGSASKIKFLDALVLPGVGSFGPAMANLKRQDLIGAVRDSVRSGKPYLGLCLGFQFLFSESEEEGRFRGFDIVKGKVKKFIFPAQGPMKKLKIPHMGWNNVSVTANSKKMFSGIDDNSYFYFVHSYYAVPNSKTDAAGVTNYGLKFCSALEKGNIWACQFHPEKSGATGIRLLKNFVNEVNSSR